MAFWRGHRWWTYLGVGLLGLVSIVAVAAAFIDEPLRAFMEQRANAALKGYSVAIGRVDFHPWGLSIDLYDVVLLQDRHPEPMIMIPRWDASLQWRGVLTGHLVSDHEFERPVIRITRSQAEDEARDEEKLRDRGWQEAVLAIYPVKINELRIIDGELSYTEEAETKPLRLQHVDFVAGNIRNIESPNQVYPSDVALTGQVFDSGRVAVTGHADFLAQPHIGVDVDVELSHLAMKDFLPLAGRINLQVREGMVEAKGHVEYAPTVKHVDLHEVTVDGLRVDYVKSETSKPKMKKVVTPPADPKATPVLLRVRIENGKMINSELGFVNKSVSPNYRVFLSQAEMEVHDFTNRFDSGIGDVTLVGRFMGNGKLTSAAVFRPNNPLPDFDLKVKILKTSLKSMNNVLRAHAGADVNAGTFAFFSEMTVQRGKLKGYLRPFFKDVDVYDAAQDEDKGLFQQVYEGVLDGLVSLLENSKRDEVATETPLSGPLSDPRADTWEIIVNLITNAFVKAIVPGFKHTLSPSN